MTAIKHGDFLIYEEHSVYRREFLERVASAADAHTRALAYSRRTRLPVSVRITRGTPASSAIMSSYLRGKCLRTTTMQASDGAALNCAGEA